MVYFKHIEELKKKNIPCSFLIPYCPEKENIDFTLNDVFTKIQNHKEKYPNGKIIFVGTSNGARLSVYLMRKLKFDKN